MARDWRWDPCISHSGDAVSEFIDDYFADTNRNVIVIAGAGFDPRACVISRKLAVAGAPLRGLFLRKIDRIPRPNSYRGLRRISPICRRSCQTTRSFLSISSAAISP